MPTAGWTGRRRRFSRPSWRCSGAITGRRRRSATGAAIRDAQERTSAAFRLLDRHLADRAFLAGDRLTIADIPAGTALHRYFGLDLERPALPNVEAWYGRLRERAAFRDHTMLRFDDLKGRLAF